MSCVNQSFAQLISDKNIWFILLDLIARAGVLWIFAKYVLKIARASLKFFFSFHKKRTFFKSRLLVALIKPLAGLYMVSMIYFFVSGFTRKYLNNFGQMELSFLINTAILIIIFYSLYKVLDAFAQHLKHKSMHTTKFNEEFQLFLFRCARVLIIALGAMALLDHAGINVFGFVAGLGLLGMAIALAAQDTLKNFFGSLTILMDQTFKRGDYIKTKDFEGHVEHLGFRTTTIRQPDKAVVTVPNARLVDAPLVNMTKMHCRRLEFTLPLSYDTSPDQIAKITSKILAYIKAHPEFEVDPKKVNTVVRLDQLGDNAIQILCYFFTRTTKWVEYMALKEEALLAFMKIISKEGAKLAEPLGYSYSSK